MPARSGHSRERGTALLTALLLVVLLSATGLGLALTASLESPIARNFEAGVASVNAADAALVLTAHELAQVDDWTGVLAGTWVPDLLESPPADYVASVGPRRVSLAGLTHLANCQHTEPCSQTELQESTLERPWGLNNPSWRLLGVMRAGSGGLTAPGMPFDVVVWVGDDPGEVDGDPLLDGGPPPDDPLRQSPGLGRLALRAESFAPAGAFGAVEVTAVRVASGGSVRLVGWTGR